MPEVHSTILSIQIQDSLPVERKYFFGVPAPGLIGFELIYGRTARGPVHIRRALQIKDVWMLVFQYLISLIKSMSL